MALIPGSPDNDTLAGGLLGDEMYGYAGNDRLNGMRGHDTLDGGDGLDTLHGGYNDDLLLGGDGNDKLYGEYDQDRLEGGNGQDLLEGGYGNDILIGGASRDSLFGGIGADTFVYSALTDSTFGDVDIIYDFEHGIDKIDLSALGYTGITTGHASATELRVAYSAAADRTYLRDDHSDFEIALKGDLRTVLTDSDFRFTPAAGSVGYYEAEDGTGGHTAAFAAPITDLGLDAVSLDTLSANELSGLSAVFILNSNNNHYHSELLNAGTALADYVFNGGVLIIHDRFVDNAEQLLPGLSGETILRSFDDPQNINFVDDGGLIADGPGGHLTDASLDNGTSSSHGYALAETLGPDVVSVQTNGTSSHVVSFAYAYGAGAVYFSAIPLDYYLQDQAYPPSLNDAMQAYAENVISWAVLDHHNLFDL